MKTKREQMLGTAEKAMWQEKITNTKGGGACRTCEDSLADCVAKLKLLPNAFHLSILSEI